jgi:hypothetical protein
LLPGHGALFVGDALQHSFADSAAHPVSLGTGTPCRLVSPVVEARCLWLVLAEQQFFCAGTELPCPAVTLVETAANRGLGFDSLCLSQGVVLDVGPNARCGAWCKVVRMMHAALVWVVCRACLVGVWVCLRLQTLQQCVMLTSCGVHRWFALWCVLGCRV